MASSREYWAQRFEMLHEAELAKGEGLIADLEIIHRQTAAAIEADLAKWYARFAVNNEVDMATAKQMLTSGELAELRWNVEDYIMAGKQNALDQSWLKELENASDKVHISRLEALMMQMQQHVEVFYGNQLDKVDTLLSDIYKSGYYHTAFEVQKGVGVGWSMQSLNDKQVSAVLSKPWTADGKTFSDRIWTAKADMIDTLHRELTQSVVRGDDPKKVIKTISDDYSVSKTKAGRLVMTESAFVSAASQKDAFESLGVEQYEIVATLDNKTSSICQGLDGKVFDMSDFAPGHTAPPFHVWCRSVTAPHFEDEDGYRAARSKDGKTYHVDSNMTYSDWQAEYVEDAKRSPSQKGHAADKEQHKRYLDTLGKEKVGGFGDFEEMKYNDVEKWQQMKAEYRKVNAYNRIKAKEPQITDDVKAVADQTETVLAGLEYRVKTLDSFMRKVASDSGGTVDLRAIDETVSTTNDVIRYTFVSDGQQLVNKYSDIRHEMESAGYEHVKTKNTWNDKQNPYNGVNSVFKSPDGQKFEVQFHTQESFDLKNGRLHELYEEARQDGCTPERKVELITEMNELSGKLKRPKGIEGLEG